MTIVEFHLKKNTIIQGIEKGTMNRADAKIELDLLNAEAKKAELEVALLDVKGILDERFTGGSASSIERTYNDESYDDSTDSY